jgi:hypothetical protein
VHVASVATTTVSESSVDLPSEQGSPRNTSLSKPPEDSDKAKQIAASKTLAKANHMDLQLNLMDLHSRR